VAQLLSARAEVPARPVSVQRCGSAGCADCGPKRDEEAANQGVPGYEDEFAGPAQTVVQRVASFTASPVHEVNNLADCVVNGAPAGLTWPTLNGTQFWSVAAAQAAMVRPTVTTAAVAAGGFDAEVGTVPVNTGSYDETVLARGPWRLNTTKGTIGGMLPTLTMCTGPHSTKFQAKGSPTDNAMYRANRRHEDHHVADHRTAFNATFGAWDTKLTAAKANGQKFHGATAADAEAALWAAVGGTPDQVAADFMNQCQAAVIAYHSSAAGGPVSAPTKPHATARCAVSSAEYTNPS
jgi:hypothetical protein